MPEVRRLPGTVITAIGNVMRVKLDVSEHDRRSMCPNTTVDVRDLAGVTANDRVWVEFSGGVGVIVGEQ